MGIKYCAILIITFWWLPSLAQDSASIIGQVIDANSGQPISGATVILPGPNIGTTTDSNGLFKFDDVDKGFYQLVVSYVGMKTDTSLVELNTKSIFLTKSLENRTARLSEIVVIDKRDQTGIQRLRSVENTAIYASKKNDLILLDRLTVNKAANISRQIYARVSGLNIWESDGAGIQLGIGGRGLSPNRNSNFNTRQNGYDISADALGYPESYYTPPVEAIDRIEIVRGAASLQYGTQFGGMLNFKFKKGVRDKKIALTSRQTAGSFGFLSSFNSIGGSAKKLNYYSFYQYKRSDGWRPNSSLDQHNAFGSLTFSFHEKLEFTFEYTHSQYLAQQPGGLTDVEFEADPRQSKRARNWFSVNWNLFAISMDWQLNDHTKLNNRVFGLVAGRDALGNLSNINLLDFGLNRDFLSDEFRNIGNETRLLNRYSVFDQPAILLVGFRYYKGKTIRKQGEGSDGSDADFTYLNPGNLEGSDFELPSENLSFFAENIFNLNETWSVTPGLRWESIQTEANGYYRDISRDLAGNIINDNLIIENKENSRSFFLAGLGISFRPNEQLEIYSNISQNYRAINFNDLRVNVGSLVVDQELKDESGFTLDIGARGSIKKLISFDASIFHISYNDRIGTLLKKEANPVFDGLVDRVIRFRSNIADASIFGLESLIEINAGQLIGVDNQNKSLSLFSNFSWTTAHYSSDDATVDGNKVELVPSYTLKTGINLVIQRFRSSLQYAYTDKHFSDASNAIRTPTAIEGVIPSYGVVDLSMSYAFSHFKLETGINNLANASYFTRRATGYPGPGIIPSVGRNIYLSFEVKL